MLIAAIEGHGPLPVEQNIVEVMRWMGWNYRDWDACPAWLRDDIITRMRWAAKLKKKQHA